MWSILRCYKQGTKSVELSSAWEAVKTEPEHVKLKNFHCHMPLPGNS
jgi:hypothetical protein